MKNMGIGNLLGKLGLVAAVASIGTYVVGKTMYDTAIREQTEGAAREVYEPVGNGGALAVFDWGYRAPHSRQSNREIMRLAAQEKEAELRQQNPLEVIWSHYFQR